MKILEMSLKNAPPYKRRCDSRIIVFIENYCTSMMLEFFVHGADIILNKM